jgi:Domain of unknown function (DUF4258)
MIGLSRGKTNIVPVRMTASVAQSRIREIAKVTANVMFGDHALRRMNEREIVDVDVYRTLRDGYVDEAPERTKHGEWQCKVTLKIRGGRTAGVVTIILHNGKLFVKTVEWEDLS